MPTYQPEPGVLEPIETASTDELRALQQIRLRATLRHAYDDVTHYRTAFDAVGLHPDDITGLDQLPRLPFTTKADLRRHYPFGMFAVPRERVARIHASSGTTGQPTVVGYTTEDLHTWAVLVARSLRAGGARPGQLLHNAYGYGLFTGGLGVHAGAEHLGCTVLRDALEGRLDIHAVDIYGLSEVMGPGVAQECLETKDGLHVWEDHFYPEIIDPRTGQVLPDGQLGELVFTSLTKQAMPVVRYRTGDLTRLLPGTARSMRRIQKITGRTDDMIILRGVNVFPTQIEELLLQQPALAPHFQCVLGRQGPLDTMTVTAEPAPGVAQDTAAAAAGQLAERVKNTIGVTVAVRLVPAGSIERSTGKMRRIVDTRNPAVP
jgi:phenylacetate-CoA ligase